jgi:hypothetical protein
MPTPFKTRRGGIATQIIPPGEMHFASSGNTAQLVVHVDGDTGQGQLGTLRMYTLHTRTMASAECLEQAVHARAFDVVLAGEQSCERLERVLHSIRRQTARHEASARDTCAVHVAGP